MAYTKEKINMGSGAIVIYLRNFINRDSANELFTELFENLEWKQFDYTVQDKEVKSPRLMHILDFDEELDCLPLLSELKDRLEKKTHRTYNYAVLNYYRDGKDYISYHADREVKPGSVVVSVSLGARRKFMLKHKFDKNIKFEFMLGGGDVLVLNEHAIKTSFKHAVPKMVKVGCPRISITFRE